MILFAYGQQSLQVMNYVILWIVLSRMRLIPMQPSPIADTSRLLFPSLRFCIVSPFGVRFPHLKAKAERRGTGILILPIHCLFLSLPTISCRFIHDSALFLILKGALRGTRGESEDCKQRAISTRS